ncbi:facilitated trehalose transporter Tret1 [Anopheles arabiensis]|uniref:facilitated trehalose transporter Tret1 n=1 Tax=Anopheles arabiensis TaxID=7173 RepID=UPI001AACA25B|nr:facilitated trehalose transporter Tret1 [Anopheles arabiensis]
MTPSIALSILPRAASFQRRPWLVTDARCWCNMSSAKQMGRGQYRNEYIAALAATSSLVASVACAGWSSPALPVLRGPNSPIPITPDEGSWVVSLLSIGSLFGPIICGLFVDRYGRKPVLLVSAVPLVAGWLFIVFAESVGMLYTARLLHGIGYGLAYSLTPIYLGEISSNAVRGSTGVLVTVMAKLAFLFEYSVGPYVGFRALAWISLALPVGFVVLFFWMPETPYYLLARGNKKAAADSLRWLRRSSTIDEELGRMEKLVLESKQRGNPLKQLLLTSTNKKSLVIILLLSFGMQLTGINAILGYSQTIFSRLALPLTAAELSIVLALVQLGSVMLPTFLVDRAGRRPLLLASTGGSFIGLAMCAVYFTLDETTTDVLSPEPGAAHGWIPFAGVLLFIISFAIGLATVPFAILGEVFPKHIKAAANSVFGVITSAVVFSVVKLFQVISDGAGTYVSFWIFTGCTATTGVLIYLIIPETKGQSFERIQEIMMRRGRTPTMTVLILLLLLIPISSEVEIDCNSLRMGQFICPDPALRQIDPKTQQLRGCTPDNKARVWCVAVEGIVCSETKNTSFTREMPCKWTNGYHFDTALLLSVFLGMFGADRFYLGYPAIGLLKFCTLGFMFLGQLVDVILIATQVVGPADGSAYIIPYYGPVITVVRSDNWTYRLPQDNW